MKFSTKEDVEAPIDFVFNEVSDFQAFERAALRRGAEIQRVDGLQAPGVGMSWRAQFKFRGRKREARIDITQYDRPNALVCTFETGLLQGTLDVDLVALSRNRTRLSIVAELSPRNLTARLLMQSIKLARSSVDKKFRFRVAHFAKELEERHKRLA
ncbi:SRPBCC family protein [Roseovarius sp. A21]|uniref:SRPBCC family protein n=1 Tax=Roseovarius bejariae TaxID=2576383 RepID=A0A844CIF8_9RHOB|nr:SRPBCC family protein [Roseovarius bejariae]MRU15101.1 SRPBCC family protein [Roseovarius bejariae]